VTSKVQLGLFSPQLPESDRLDVTLARITAIVGEGNVGQAVLSDTHSPKEFHIGPFQVFPPKDLPDEHQPRLCRRILRPAEITTVRLERGRPCELAFRARRYAVEQAYGPWLSGGDWWNEAIWGDEQWDIMGRAGDSSFLACRLARDFVQNRWQVTALYD
jgi:protein ImuB